MDINNLDTSIKRTLAVSYFLFFIAVLISILSGFGVLKPDTESFAIWFQRSGSITVVLAIVIEFQLFDVNNKMYSSRIHFNQLAELKNKYEKPHKILSILTALLAVIGTLIWGYGDLIR